VVWASVDGERSPAGRTHGPPSYAVGARARPTGTVLHMRMQNLGDSVHVLGTVLTITVDIDALVDALAPDRPPEGGLSTGCQRVGPDADGLRR